MKKKIGLFILLLFLFSACSSQIASLTPDIETPNVPTPVPTLEKNPTKTQETSLEPDQSPITATVEALVNDCKVVRYGPSPDRRWITIRCDNYKIDASDEASTTLKVVNLETLQEWVVSYYQLYGKKEIESIGEMTDGAIFPVNWPDDGTHMYIGVMPQVYREYYYNRTAALYILNLETGELNELLDAGEIQETFYDFSFSHDERKIAHINLMEKPIQIKLRSLDADKTQSAQLDSKYATAGSIVWSQDDNSLIFLAITFNENSVSNTLFKWDTETGGLIELLHLPDMLGRKFFIVKWDEVNNIVTLKNYEAEEFFNVNLSTGEILPASL